MISRKNRNQNGISFFLTFLNPDSSEQLWPYPDKRSENASLVCNHVIFPLLSKSARRKKREEAEKVPEVSKEIYYDVFCDLKAAFGQKKDGKPEEEEKMNWDQHVDAEEEGELPEAFPAADSSVAERESSGFQFSFFGDDAERGGAEAGRSALPEAPASGPRLELSFSLLAEYKVESISATRQPWQQDPRLHDSSSEEDEDGPKDEEAQIHRE